MGEPVHAETMPGAARERAIIMSGASVRGIIAGTKTQTRRVVRFPVWAAGCFDDPLKIEVETDEGGRDPEVICNDTGCLAALPLPYRVGDRLWVRESWCPIANDDGSAPSQTPDGCLYRADGAHVVLDDGDGFAVINADGSERSPWRSSAVMPRWASRLTIIVKDVRVQRLQEISEADARAEGCSAFGPSPGDPHEGVPIGGADDAYRHFWNAIHGKDAWDLNPWVAALTFERAPVTPAPARAAETGGRG